MFLLIFRIILVLVTRQQTYKAEQNNVMHAWAKSDSKAEENWTELSFKDNNKADNYHFIIG